jgi:hypothetical protein
MWLPVRTFVFGSAFRRPGEFGTHGLPTELCPVRTKCSMTLVCAPDVGPSRHGQVRSGTRTMGRSRELLAPYIPPPGPPSGHGHPAPIHGWPPVSPATGYTLRVIDWLLMVAYEWQSPDWSVAAKVYEPGSKEAKQELLCLTLTNSYSCSLYTLKQ